VGVVQVPADVVQAVAAIGDYTGVREANAGELDGAWAASDDLRALEAHWKALGEAETVTLSSFVYKKSHGGVFDTDRGPVKLVMAPSSVEEQDAQIVLATWSGGRAMWLEYWAPGSAGPELTLVFATRQGLATTTFETFVSEVQELGRPVRGEQQQALEKPDTLCNSFIENVCEHVAGYAETGSVNACLLRALPTLLRYSKDLCLPLAPTGIGLPVCATVLAATLGVAFCHATAGLTADAVEGLCNLSLGCGFKAVGFESCSCVEFASDVCAEQCQELASASLCGIVEKKKFKTSRTYKSPIFNALCRKLQFSGTRGPLSKGGEICKEALSTLCENVHEGVVADSCNCLCKAAASLDLNQCSPENLAASGDGGASAGGADAGGASGASSAGAGDELEAGATGYGGATGGGGDSGDGEPVTGAAARSIGDPHFATFDGLAYDFQAPGEFVLSALVADPLGDRVQARHEGLSTDICPHVTLNTAVAARLGGKRIALYAGAAPTLLVDGTPLDLAEQQTVELGSGVSLARPSTPVWEARWADNGHLRLQVNGWQNDHHIDVTFTPPSSWQGLTRGLLGDRDGIAGNDLRLADDSFLVPPFTWEDFYLRYAAAHRVTEDDTLFDYGPGQSALTFQRLTLPGRPATPDSLPPDLRHAAEEICAATGVEHPTLLDACVLDVACSGGDARQADWIKTVPTPVETLMLDAEPVREPLPSTFVTTTGLYDESDDLTAACQAELGPNSELADWLDVRGIPTPSLDAWRTSMGLVTNDADELLLMVNGQRTSAGEHHFITWHDHAPPAGSVNHDQLDNHLIDLASRPTVHGRVLCRLCGNEPCGLSVGSQPSNPGSSCADIVEQQGARGDGSYWIQPPGASTPLEVSCDMSVLGGGWTRLTAQLAPLLDTQSQKSYLYLLNGRWYRSPITSLAWSWAQGQELLGTYSYFNGLETSSYVCNGSNEKPPYGIGCSSGPFDTLKTIPWFSPNPQAGVCPICQNLVGAFGPGACYNDVAIYVRTEP
jgi:hypothetical protein